MHEGMHMARLESECTEGRENCKKISKRMHCLKKELIGEMTEKIMNITVLSQGLLSRIL